MTTAYLGSIQYYRKLLREGLPIDLSVSYRKQTCMNRCYIDSPHGALALSVPVVNPHGRTPVGDILISEHGNWRHQHWNALVSSYRQTPYFDYYADFFRPFYEKETKFLVDLNEGLHDVIIRLLTNNVAMGNGLWAIGENRTSDWQGLDLESCFGNGQSILDMLFEYGPETVIKI